MAITIDPASKRLILDSVSVTAQAIYAAWVDWVALSDNMKYLPAFSAVGGDDLGGGLLIPPYYFLQNGWKVRPMEANHNLTITGNLFVSGGGVPVVQTLGTFQVNVNYTVPVQAQGIATAGGSDPAGSVLADGVTLGDAITQILRFVAADATGHPLAPVISKLNGTGTAMAFTLDADGNRVRTAFDPS